MKGAGFYDAHSEYQRRVIEGGDELIGSAVGAIDLERLRGAFAVVDYGAGTGATSVHAVGTAVTALRARDSELPVLAIHNDVATTDFTELLRNLTKPGGYLGTPGGPIYPAAVPGSFFTQVVPSSSVHLGMCSNAAHWLRTQPSLPTPDGMYFADSHGDARRAARRAGGRRLAGVPAVARRRAVVRRATRRPGDRLGRRRPAGVRGPAAPRDVAGRREPRRRRAARSRRARRLRVPGVLPERGRGDSAGRPGATLAGAFEVESVGVDEVASPYWEAYERDGDAEAYATAYVEFVRAFAESTLSTHLFEPGARGTDPAGLVDEYFDRLRTATAADPEAGRYEAWIVRLVLRRA